MKNVGMVGLIVKRMIVSLGLVLLFTGCGEVEQQEAQKSEWEQTSENGSAEADRLKEDELVQELDACVRVEAAGYSGRGVIYEEKEDGLWIVTAAHVVGAATKPQDVRISLADGTTVSGTELQVMEEADLAFLRIVKEELGDTTHYKVVKKNREIFDALCSDDGVFMEEQGGENEFGFRFAMVVESWIYVEDFGQHMILLSGEADAGMSGCGVFTVDGCFLGILCGRNDQSELAVLPYSVIESNSSKVYKSDY